MSEKPLLVVDSVYDPDYKLDLRTLDPELYYRALVILRRKLSKLFSVEGVLNFPMRISDFSFEEIDEFFGIAGLNPDEKFDKFQEEYGHKNIYSAFEDFSQFWVNDLLADDNRYIINMIRRRPESAQRILDEILADQKPEYVFLFLRLERIVAIFHLYDIAVREWRESELSRDIEGIRARLLQVEQGIDTLVGGLVANFLSRIYASRF